MDAHPEIYRLFEQYALKAAAQGRRFGINLLRERVRWECAFSYDTEFKICNTHSPYIARRLLRQHPHLGDFLTVRSTQES